MFQGTGQTSLEALQRGRSRIPTALCSCCTVPHPCKGHSNDQIGSRCSHTVRQLSSRGAWDCCLPRSIPVSRQRIPQLHEVSAVNHGLLIKVFLSTGLQFRFTPTFVAWRNPNPQNPVDLRRRLIPKGILRSLGPHCSLVSQTLLLTGSQGFLGKGMRLQQSPCRVQE